MLFPSDFLTRLEYLSIISKRVFRGSLLAQRRTVQMGSGIEFSDHREYAQGDDFRYLDWNVYARHGDLLLKRFQEEQDLNVYLMLDCSRSMGFGDPPKFDLARHLIAALAYIALADLDRITVLAFSEKIVKEFPLTRGKARILPLMRFLEKLEVTGHNTNLGRSARGLVHRNNRPGLAVVVSDLFDEHGFEAGLDQLRYRRFDGHVIQLYDPQEARRKASVCHCRCFYHRHVVNSPRHHIASVTGHCRNYEIGCTQTPATIPFDDLVLRMMRESGQVG